MGVAHVTRAEGYGIVATRTVDLMLTGHTHDLFINYDGRNALVESSYDAHYVTAIDVKIDVKVENGRRVTTWWPEFRVIDTTTVTPDPEVAAVVAGYEQLLSLALDQPLGTTAVELDSRTATVRTREAAIGDLFADAMRAATHADAAITNGGGIRGGRIFSPGATISRRDIISEMPFDNRVVILEISGAALKQAIENGLSRLPSSSGGFPQVSGLTIEADPSRPPGNRVLSIKVGDAPLDENRMYRVATNDFLARGGDGYTMFRDATPVLPAADSPLLFHGRDGLHQRSRHRAHESRRADRSEVALSATGPAQRPALIELEYFDHGLGQSDREGRRQEQRRKLVDRIVRTDAKGRAVESFDERAAGEAKIHDVQPRNPLWSNKSSDGFLFRQQVPPTLYKIDQHVRQEQDEYDDQRDDVPEWMRFWFGGDGQEEIQYEYAADNQNSDESDDAQESIFAKYLPEFCKLNEDQKSNKQWIGQKLVEFDHKLIRFHESGSLVIRLERRA